MVSPLILVANDNLLTLKVLRDYLYFEQYRVVASTTSLVVVQLAQAIKLDLVLMDVQMDGLKVTRCL